MDDNLQEIKRFIENLLLKNQDTELLLNIILNKIWEINHPERNKKIYKDDNKKIPDYFNISKIKNSLTELKNLQTNELDKIENWDNIEEIISEEEAQEIIDFLDNLKFPFEMITENIFNKRTSDITKRQKG